MQMIDKISKGDNTFFNNALFMCNKTLLTIK